MKQYMFAFQPPFGPDVYDPNNTPIDVKHAILKASDGQNVHPQFSPDVWHVPHTYGDYTVASQFHGVTNWLDLEPYAGFWMDPVDQMVPYVDKFAETCGGPVVLVYDYRRMHDGGMPSAFHWENVKAIAPMAYWTTFQEEPINVYRDLFYHAGGSVPFIPILPLDAAPNDIAWFACMVKPQASALAYWRSGTEDPGAILQLSLITQALRSMVPDARGLGEWLS